MKSYAEYNRLDRLKWRDRMKIGESLKAVLPELRTQREVAREVGISAQAVGKIEKKALWKIYVRMKGMVL